MLKSVRKKRHGLARRAPRAPRAGGARAHRRSDRRAREAAGRRVTLLRLASRRTFASLRHHRNYRLFFAGQLTSVAGTWMQNIALAWLVVQLAPHSRGLAVGLLAICRFGPFTVLGLFAGVVTDRFDNRRTVIVDAVRADVVLRRCSPRSRCSATCSSGRSTRSPSLTGIALVFDAPSRQNLTFQMVGRDELPNAIALNSSLFNTARIFGPALAGVVIAAWRRRLVLRDQHRQLPRGARRPARDAHVRALPARSTAAARPFWRGTREGLALRAPQPHRAGDPRR